MMNNFNNDNFWGKMAKIFANEATLDEEVEMDVAVRGDHEAEKSFEQAQKLWGEASYTAVYNSIDSSSAFNHVKSRINQRSSVRLRMRVLIAVAASVAILVVAGLAFFNPFSGTDKSVSGQQLAVASTAVTKVVLHDGTNVELNAGSQLSYPEVFGEQKRSVKLNGEAFFKVASNKEVPFYIEAGQVTVRVVGTSFNVKAYPDTRSVEVTVEEGVVEVWGKTDKVVLTEGFRAVFNAASGMLVKSLNTDLNYIAWKTGRLVFKEAPLKEVLETLTNVYHVGFVAADPALLDGKLTATFDQQDADHVAQVVARTFNLQVRMSDGAYLFSIQ